MMYRRLWYVNFCLIAVVGLVYCAKVLGVSILPDVSACEEPEEQVIVLPDVSEAITIYQGEGESIGLPRVALTFDSGWIFEPTTDILRILREEDIRATFFLRGGWIEKNPELVQQIAAGGHSIGNHSLSHKHMTELCCDETRNEIGATTRLVDSLTGRTPFLFRPPYGEFNTEMLKILAEEGYCYNIMWTIDTHDWKEPGINYIYERAVSKMVDGCIILMHVGSYQTPMALPRIIAEYKAEGFRFVTVDQMILGDSVYLEQSAGNTGDENVESQAKTVKATSNGDSDANKP